MTLTFLSKVDTPFGAGLVIGFNADRTLVHLSVASDKCKAGKNIWLSWCQKHDKAYQDSCSTCVDEAKQET